MTDDSHPPLVLADFESLVGTHFHSGELALRLAGAASIGSEPGADGRPFSLLFRAKQKSPLDQQTHELTHETLGNVAIFLVPVNQIEDEVEYEAVFT